MIFRGGHLHAARPNATSTPSTSPSQPDSEDRADEYVGRIVDFFKSLAIFPMPGTPRDDFLPGLRVTGFEQLVTVAFVVTDAAVLIEGIFYGRRDFEATLHHRDKDDEPDRDEGGGGILSTVKSVAAGDPSD